jgi:hypothetical protein
MDACLICEGTCTCQSSVTQARLTAPVIVPASDSPRRPTLSTFVPTVPDGHTQATRPPPQIGMPTLTLVPPSQTDEDISLEASLRALEPLLHEDEKARYAGIFYSEPSLAVRREMFRRLRSERLYGGESI